MKNRNHSSQLYVKEENKSTAFQFVSTFFTYSFDRLTENISHFINPLK